MSIEALIIFFISRYLQKSLNTKEAYPAWDVRFKWAMIVSMGLFVCSFFLWEYAYILSLVIDAVLLWFIYMLYTDEMFKKAKQIVIALAPYIIFSFLLNFTKLVLPKIFDKWGDPLGLLVLFGIIWGVGVWIVTARQRKELEKAKAKVEEEQKNNQMIALMKDELEIQVAERTAEITRQKEELEEALNELKSTQSQLIQSEKMASLGELTAGIAHEIQNPLNFVNNFSEVNREMIDEVAEEMSKNNYDEVKNILTEIKGNSEKINHHGKRAAAIVKAMLQHSRVSTGQKEPTDINALCDEYLRLAFHGLRAKDKSFNVKFETQFDETLPKINIVAQDMGRVILNLINNAFYAVNERKKKGEPDYEPMVRVSTQKEENKILIQVADNGSGIPQDIVDKVFQPFFTTKPSGQGTGLGLSLSYDIITKGHKGSLEISTKENSGTTFSIYLPYLNLNS